MCKAGPGLICHSLPWELALMWWARLPSASNVLTEAPQTQNTASPSLPKGLYDPVVPAICLGLFPRPPPPGKSCPLGVNCKKYHSSTVCGCFRQSIQGCGPSVSSGEAPNSGSWLPQSTKLDSGQMKRDQAPENNRFWFGSFPDSLSLLTRSPPCPQSLHL